MIEKAGLGLLVAAALAAAWGCSDDESGGGASGAAGAAGSAGSTGGSAGSTGGSAGSTGGSAGASGSGGTAGADAGDGSISSGQLLIAATDFFSKTEIAAIDLQSGAVSANVTLSDGDAVPVASGGRGFVLERTNDVVHSLKASGEIDKSISVGSADAGGTNANPTGLIAIGTKAYVSLYGKNAIAVVDLSAGTHASSIDLSPYLASGDGDGAVDVGTPIHDPTSNRVYFTLGRIDRTTIAPPSYELACPSAPSLLLAIDGANGAIVDLNGAAAGEAISLTLINPVDVALDAGRLLVLSAGCFTSSDGGSVRTKHGAEAIELASGQTSIALVPGDGSFFSRLLLVASGSALVNSFDPFFAEHWQRWTTSQTSLGSELSGVPAAPSFDGAGRLVGAEFSSVDGGASASIVAYDLTSSNKTVLAQNPWQGSFSSASASAILMP